MARAGKNGTHAIADSSAAVVTAVSWSRGCWPGRQSSHGARSWDPATVPHPVALWNRACGGQAGLNTWVELRSAPAGADHRADRRTAEDQTANSHSLLVPARAADRGGVRMIGVDRPGYGLSRVDWAAQF
jgi:hypothetical protein